MPATLETHEELARRFPRDIAAVKLGQYHSFNLGDAPGLLRLAERAFDANADNPFMHGMLSFGYEECHLLDAAERAARTALERQRHDPWAQHTLAHVLETNGRFAEGVQVMTGYADTWSDLNSFMLTHNWWHTALFLMDADRLDDALALFDRHVWGVWKAYSQDQVGAASLLMRLELRGVDVGDRWADVADHCAVRVDDHVSPFLDLQYLLALARAGRPEAATLMASLERFAKTAPAWSRGVWQAVAVPAGRAILAFANRDWRTAADLLRPVLPRLIEIGGSHAQRDLFVQLYLHALIRAGYLVEAQQLLEPRRLARPDVAETSRLLARVYDGLGLAREAAAARSRAAALHDRYVAR